MFQATILRFFVCHFIVFGYAYFGLAHMYSHASE